MNSVRLFLGYESASLGLFSCQNGMPLGKKQTLTAVIAEFDSRWLKGIYCGAYLRGGEIPTFGMIAELSSDCMENIAALTSRVKEVFPKSEIWVVAKFGFRRISYAVSLSLGSSQEADAEAVALYNNKLYDFYKESHMPLRAFIVREGRNLVLRAMGCAADYANLSLWLDGCNEVYLKTKSYLNIGEPIVSRVYGIKG